MKPTVFRSKVAWVFGWAWIVFALLFTVLGLVLGATWKQVTSEAKEAGVIRKSAGEPDQAERRAREQARAQRRRRHPRG